MAYIDIDKFAESICNFQALDEDAANKMIWLLRTFPIADVVPKSEVEELKDWVEAYKNTIASMEQIDEELRTELKNAKSDVARGFRQRMNEKMGKHTHLLGKEYVQRIMREIEKEFSEVDKG